MNIIEEYAMNHSSSIILTLIFVVTFAYSLVGALIAGASSRSPQSLCFSCCFSMVIIASVIGFGFSWMRDDIQIAIWWMSGTVAFLIVTSYYARKGNTWQTPSNEPQTTGKTS